MCKIREAPNFPADQVPVHLDRGAHTVERIILAPLPETGNHESSATEKIIDAPPQGLLHLNFIFEKPPSQATIEKFAYAMNRLVKEQELPVNQIAWGGLVSWGGTQPSCAVQETMMKAVRMFKEGYLRKKSRNAGDGTVTQSGSSQHSVSDALLPSIANRLLQHRLNLLATGFMLAIGACFILVLLTGTHRTFFSVCSNLWSRFS